MDIYLNADVTLKSNVTLYNNLNVTGKNVAIINGTEDKATSVKLSLGSGVCTVSGSLVLDKNVTLEATFAKDGSLTNVNKSAEGAAVIEKN